MKSNGSPAFLVLTWKGLSTTLASIFDRWYQAFSHRVFKLPTVVTRALSLSKSLANWTLTL
jgi:hypothetical protein